GRGEGPAPALRARPLGRPAAAPLHRARRGPESGSDPDGRAGVGARPDRDVEDRRPHRPAHRALHGRDRDALDAAGGARLRLHGVLPLGRDRRGGPDEPDLHPPEREAHRGLHHRPLRVKPAAPRKARAPPAAKGASMQTTSPVPASVRPPIPRTMRALRKKAAGPGFALEEIAVPDVGPSDVLVRVKAAGVCGTDLHIYAWDHWAERRVKPPLTIGHEFMGHVAAVGSAVRAVQIGDRVSAEGHIACGICTLCRTGQAHICEHVEIIGVDTDGAFADYIRMPESNVWKLDPSIPDSWAAVFDPLG